MSDIEVIRGPRIAWSREEQTGIEIGFRVCDQETRQVKLEWHLTSTSGANTSGSTDALDLDQDRCVAVTAVVPPQDMTVIWRLRDVDRPGSLLWEGTSYLSVAGYEATLVPSPGYRLEHTGPSGAGVPLTRTGD